MTGRRQSRRFTMSLPPEQQITNFLRENPLVCSILEDDTEKMENILEANPNLNVSKQDNHKQTPLHYAAFIGNENTCVTLIRHGAQIDVKDNIGLTPLHRACAADRAQAVEVLIENGADCSIRNRNWETAWHIAAAHGAVSCLQKLLSKTGNVNIQDKCGRSALHHAAVKGQDQVTEFLIENGINVANCDRQDRRALHWAASAGHSQVVELLIAHGADVNAKDAFSNSAVHFCARNGYQMVIEQLIRSNANLDLQNSNGETALHLAAKYGHAECVDILLKSGARAELTNKLRKSALHYSVVDRENANMVDATRSFLRLVGGACRADANGKTPLHCAVQKRANQHVEVLLQFDNHKNASEKAVSLADELGNTALHYAAELDDFDLVQRLLQNRAAPNSENKLGITPFHVAAKMCSKDVVNILLQFGAIPKLDKKERSILHFAALGGRIGVMDILANIDPELAGLGNLSTKNRLWDRELERVDSSGKSVLHYAAIGQKVNMAANLLPLLPKSFLNKTDKDGKTPLHYAATNSFFLHFQKSSKKSAEIEISRNGVFENEQQSAAICDIFLQNGASVEIRDKNNFSALHCAAASNNNSSLEILHEQDHQVTNVSLLIVAALQKSVAVVEKLLQDNPDLILARDSTNKGMTALYAAAKSGCIASIEKIQEASSESQETFGENIKRLFEAGFEGKNALHVAAANNRANAFQKILSFVYHSVPVNSVFFKDNFGRTPVHYAVGNGMSGGFIEDVFDWVGETAISAVDNEKNNIFHFIAATGSVDVFKSICAKIRNVSEINIEELLVKRNSSGATPLHIAAKSGFSALVGQLLETCPLAIEVHDSNGLTPFTLTAALGRVKTFQKIIDFVKAENIELKNPCHARAFIAAINGGNMLILSVLYKYCLSLPKNTLKTWLRTKNSIQRGPLHIAARRNDTSAMNKLLAVSKLVGGNFTSELAECDRNGFNVLQVAIQNGSLEIAKEIMNIDKEGALLEQNENVEGNSPLQMAIKKKNRELALAILAKCSADQVNHRNYTGVTALHFAVESRLEICRDLLNSGADPFVFDDSARLPLFGLCESQVDIFNLCDILMNMLDRKNRSKLDELVEDESETATENGNSTSQSSRYISHLCVDGNPSLENSARLSLTSSLSSFRRSSVSSVNPHKMNGRSDSVFDDYEAF